MGKKQTRYTEEGTKEERQQLNSLVNLRGLNEYEIFEKRNDAIAFVRKLILFNDVVVVKVMKNSDVYMVHHLTRGGIR